MLLLSLSDTACLHASAAAAAACAAAVLAIDFRSREAAVSSALGTPNVGKGPCLVAPVPRTLPGLAVAAEVGSGDGRRLGWIVLLLLLAAGTGVVSLSLSLSESRRSRAH